MFHPPKSPNGNGAATKGVCNRYPLLTPFLSRFWPLLPVLDSLLLLMPQRVLLICLIATVLQRVTRCAPVAIATGCGF